VLRVNREMLFFSASLVGAPKAGGETNFHLVN